MASSSSGSASPRANSVDSPEPLLDEREFDRLGSTIPDSQAVNVGFPAGTPPKKFSATREEVSQSALSAGFKFMAKAPPRPGQFSARPNPQLIENAKLSQETLHGQLSPQLTRSSPFQDPTAQHVRRVPAPLDLSELGLPLSSSSSRSLPDREAFKSDKSESELGSNLTPYHITSPRHSPKSASKAPSPLQSELARPSRPQPPQSPAQEELSLPKLPFRDVSSASPERTSPRARHHNLASKGAPSVARGQTDKRILEELKLPLRHVVQYSHVQKGGAPSSACGDLERPARAPRTPRAHNRPIHGLSKPMLNRPLGKPQQPDRVTASHDRRSESVASNISRKRFTVNKPRSRRDPERKKNAMQQVAEHWNECMRITEDERDEANWEIERLQNEMRQQEEALKKSLHLLSEKDAQIQATQAHCKELEDQEAQAVTEKQRLSGEVEALRDQLEDSKQRAEGLSEKSRAYRAKINEAISEQQALYHRSHEFYQEAQKELRKEQSCRVLQTQTIDQALEVGRQKRAEMRQCFEEFRCEIERECQRKDKFITELEAKIVQQDEKLAREQDNAVGLRHRLEEQDCFRDSMGKIELQLQTLSEANIKNEAQSRERDQYKQQVTAELSAKLDDIMDHLKTSAEDPQPPVDMAPLMQGLEQKIVARILPAVLTVISHQSQVEDSLSLASNDFKNAIEGLRDDLKIQHQQHSRDRENEASFRDNASSLLSHILDESVKTLQACEQTGQKVHAWAEAHLQAQEKVQDQIAQQLRVRESTIGAMEQNFQLMTKTYATRVEEMRQIILQSDEEAKVHLQTTISAIQNSLDKGFRDERDKSLRALHHSEASRAELEHQLQEAREKLELANNTRENTDTTGLRLLKEHHVTVADLQKRIAQFELEAKSTAELRDRWSRDIQAIDTLRGQLRSMDERVPRVESLGENLKQMMHLNQMMNATSEYLAAERCWVDQQLGEYAPSSTQTANSTGSCIPKLSEEEVTIAASIKATPIVKPEQSEAPFSLVKVPQKADSQADPLEARRKVLVYSPTVDALSPSPPPSVKLEQRRRREAITPRSILKPFKSSSQQCSNGKAPQVEPHDLPKVPWDQSQYNRPVVGKLGKVSTNVNNEMIEQIRSSLVQPNPMYQDWSLPTVAEFEKTTRVKTISGDLERKKHPMLSLEYMEETSTKKVKTGESSVHKQGAESGALGTVNPSSRVNK